MTLRRLSWLLLLGCGPAATPSAATTPRAPQASAQVDSDPGHDEPSEPGDTAQRNDSSATEEQREQELRRPGEPSVPQGAPVLETLEGRASYYSDRLAGRSTASGEPYRLAEFTAASRDLPFGTLVRVVRLSRAGDEELGSVIVRVNDRGPFGDHRRILDLSRAAAEALDMIRAGVVPIRAEILRRGN